MPRYFGFYIDLKDKDYDVSVVLKYYTAQTSEPYLFNSRVSIVLGGIKKVKIWANTIVHNEENFIWFSIMSVVDYVDKILVYDTGSKDKTIKIIEEIKKNIRNKIIFREVGKADKHQFSRMRQRMLDESRCDWILILDGDEIWWEDSIKKVVDTIQGKGNNLGAIVVPFYNLVGDIYHYQTQDAGQYKLLGRRGHLTIRAVNRKVEGLHLKGPYGSEGFFNKEGRPIQESDPKSLLFLDAPFLHLTHLKRSSKNGYGKYKYELGVEFAKDFKYPEVLYKPWPNNITSLWVKRSKIFEIISTIKAPYINFWRYLKNL